MKPSLALLALLSLACAAQSAFAQVGDLQGPAFSQLKDAADREGDGSRDFDGDKDRGRGRDGERDGGSRDGGDRRRRRDGEGDGDRREHRRHDGPSTHVNAPPAPKPSIGERASAFINGDADKNHMQGMVILGASLGALVGALCLGPLGALIGGGLGLLASWAGTRFLGM